MVHYLQGAYRDSQAARAALQGLIEVEGVDQAAREVARDPAQFGELRGKVGWFASGAAKQERGNAERVAGAIPDSLHRIERAAEHARGSYVQGVQAQRARDAVEVPGFSEAAWDVLRTVQAAQVATGRPAQGEDHDAWQRRREEAVAGAWQKGRADPRVAGELDRFFAAATQRLGEEGQRTALRAADGRGSMELPGVGREHRVGLDELARSFVQAREGLTLSAQWGYRQEREAREAAQWQAEQRARAEERQRRGLPPEPERAWEQERERQRQMRGLGLGR